MVPQYAGLVSTGRPRPMSATPSTPGYVNFNNGDVYYGLRDYDGAVRLVRASQ